MACFFVQGYFRLDGNGVLLCGSRGELRVQKWER